MVLFFLACTALLFVLMRGSGMGRRRDAMDILSEG
jgi:hypothetical protein